MCNGVFVRAGFSVIAAGHAGVEMDFSISGEHAPANQFTAFLQGCVRALFPPGVWTQVVTTEQQTLAGKSGTSGCGVNESCELIRHLSGITAELIYLARGGLDQQQGAILHRLLDGRVDDTGMSRANGVDAYSLGVAIAAYNILKPLARIVALNIHGLDWLFGPRLEQQVLVEGGGNRGLGPVHASEILAIHVIDDVISPVL